MPLNSTVLMSPARLRATNGIISMLMGKNWGGWAPVGRVNPARLCEISLATSSISVPKSYWTMIKDTLRDEVEVISLKSPASAIALSTGTVISSATRAGGAPG